MLPLIHREWLNSPSSVVRTAYLIARLAHAGQTDKGGKPYIDHPSRAAGIVTSLSHTDLARGALMGGEPLLDATRYTLQAVALLHDVVEDTDVTLADLREDFTEPLVNLVDALTRRRNEPDDDYLRRIIAAGPLAILVKIADSTDNSDETRLERLSGGEAAKYRQKYRGFIARLIEAL